MSNLILALISFYQKYLSFDNGLLRILTPSGACKFPISCSEYAKIQIREKGVILGLILGVKRILSCY